MKCPDCHCVCSDLRDICPKCLVDLRIFKRQSGLPVTNPRASYEQLRGQVGSGAFRSSLAQLPSSSPWKSLFNRLRGSYSQKEPNTAPSGSSSPISRYDHTAVQKTSIGSERSAPSAARFSADRPKETSSFEQSQTFVTRPALAPEKSPPHRFAMGARPNLRDIDSEGSSPSAASLSPGSANDAPPREPSSFEESQAFAPPPASALKESTPHRFVTDADSNVNEALSSSIVRELTQPSRMDSSAALAPKPQFSTLEPAPTDTPATTEAQSPLPSLSMTLPFSESELTLISPSAPPTFDAAAAHQSAQESFPAPLPSLDLPAEESARDPSPQQVSTRYQSALALHGTRFKTTQVPADLEGAFAESLGELFALPASREVALSAENFFRFEGREDVAVLFEMARESLLDPDSEKRYTSDIALSIDREVSAPDAAAQLQALERSVSAPLITLKGLSPLSLSGRRFDEESESSLAPAPGVARVKAFAIDVLFTALSAAAVALVALLLTTVDVNELITGARSLDRFDALDFAMLMLLSFLALLVLVPLVAIILRGATIGQQILRLALRSTRGNRVGFTQALVWCVTMPVSLLCGGWIPLLLGRGTPHDWAARILVLKLDPSPN